MKKIIILLVCILVLSGCGSTYKVADDYKTTYKTITLSKTDDLIEKGNTVVVDIRKKEDYDKSHYKDSINIEYDNIDSIIDYVSKDSIVVIYGSSKNKSKKACEKVINIGYSLVYDLGVYK